MLHTVSFLVILPQLDIYSYFSAMITLILLFVSLIFLHTYYLPNFTQGVKLSQFVYWLNKHLCQPTSPYCENNKITPNANFNYFFAGLTISEFNPLNTYSSISIGLSFFFLSTGIILTISKSYLLNQKWVQKIFRKKTIYFVCLLGIFVERFIFNLSTRNFHLYLFITNTIILAFMLLRLGIIMKNTFVLGLPLWCCSIIITLALVSSIIRGFLKLGYSIETFPKDNPHILYFWGETTHVVRTSPRRIIKTIMTAPENLDQKNHKINLTTLGITAVGVTFAGAVWWESRVGNKISAGQLQVNRRILEVNQRALEVTEINNDRQAVKDGFMTKENYEKKWDNFGHLRK